MSNVWVVTQSGYSQKPGIEVFAKKQDALIKYDHYIDENDKTWQDLVHNGQGYILDAMAKENKLSNGWEKTYLDRAGDLMAYLKVQKLKVN